MFELWKITPAPSVVAWMNSQIVETSFGKAHGYIAATAAARGLMIATRDASPFEAAGLTVINPWES